MKKDRLIYWITTGIIAAVMLYSIVSFTIFDTAMYPEGAFEHLRLPAYFKIELTISKVLGLAALLLPGIPCKVKEFAYFGFALTLFSASIAHTAIGDPWYNIIDPLFFLGVLIVSWLYWYKLNSLQKYRLTA